MFLTLVGGAIMWKAASMIPFYSKSFFTIPENFSYKKTEVLTFNFTRFNRFIRFLLKLLQRKIKPAFL